MKRCETAVQELTQPKRHICETAWAQLASRVAAWPGLACAWCVSGKSMRGDMGACGVCCATSVGARRDTCEESKPCANRARTGSKRKPKYALCSVPWPKPPQDNVTPCSPNSRSHSLWPGEEDQRTSGSRRLSSALMQVVGAALSTFTPIPDRRDQECD